MSRCPRDSSLPFKLQRGVVDTIDGRTNKAVENQATPCDYMPDQCILEAVAQYYLASGDFNGIQLDELARRLNMNLEDLVARLRDLVRQEKIGVLGYSDVNPHILRLGFGTVEQQLECLSPGRHLATCYYVRPPHMSSFVGPAAFAGEPYKRELALGTPQLDYRVFDLMVLEHYRNDPRYQYSSTDVDGSICISDAYFASHAISESDKVLLQTFGFAYDESMQRAVAVFLRYLAGLTPEHQQIWKARELAGEYKLHPDYFDHTILGQFTDNVPICTALCMELAIVNQMAIAMGRAPLFRKDFGKYGESRPRDFALLIRPTRKELDSFIHLLDRMLSDNLNHAFFGSDVSFEKETIRTDGRVQVDRKGTLQALDEWIRSHYRPTDWSSCEQSIAALKEVRKLRQKPAHGLDDDHFDQKLFLEQRDLLEKAYTAVRTIRLLFQNHPLVRQANIEINDSLFEGKVISY